MSDDYPDVGVRAEAVGEDVYLWVSVNGKEFPLKFMPESARELAANLTYASWKADDARDALRNP